MAARGSRAHARQSAAAAQPQPPAPKLPGPIEQVEGITPSLLAALSCHHTAAVGHHVHMGTAHGEARRGEGMWRAASAHLVQRAAAPKALPQPCHSVQSLRRWRRHLRHTMRSQ